MKVMTFNLRVVARRDGDNIFYNRKPRIIEAIRKERPDIIGFQEANDEMRAFLVEALPEYTFFGCGREKDLTGEGTPIAFLTEKFRLIKGENFWLSPTPEIPATRYEIQSDCPRVTTAVKLFSSECEPFWFVNTHLDHISSSARVLGADQLVEYMKGLDRVIFMGDLNAKPETEEIAVLEAALTNVTKSVGNTFHGYYQIEPEKERQIDYIFTNMTCDGERSYALDAAPINGIYISDHKPVCAIIE